MNQSPNPPSPPNLKQKLINHSLNYLKVRARTKHELAGYLERYTKDPELIESVLDYLNELKLIDDAAFADWFVVSRLNHKPKGPLIIRQELKRFGVSSELIEQALSKIDPQNYYQAALRLLEKNARKFEHLPAYQAKLKAGTFLYSKGFETVTREAAIDDFFNKQ